MATRDGFHRWLVTSALSCVFLMGMPPRISTNGCRPKWPKRFLVALLMLIAGLHALHAGPAGNVDAAAVHRAATTARSVHLDAASRIHLADSFHALVSIQGGSRNEQPIRDECQRRLLALGARTIPIVDGLSNPPVNLAMRFEGIGSQSNHPALQIGRAHV